MTTTHILVDFENVQPDGADVALVRDPRHRLWLFRGPNQTRYKADFAEALLALGGRVQVIRCAKSGRNALDMHIAFHIGRLIGDADAATAQGRAAAGEADAFVVVSSDTDYLPVLEYVRSLGYEARSVPNLPAALGEAKGRRAKKAPAAAAKPAPRAAHKEESEESEANVGDGKRGERKRGDPQHRERRSGKQPAKAPAKKAAKAAPAAEAEGTPRAPSRRGGRGRGSALTSKRADDGAAPGAAVLLGKLAADLSEHPESRPTRLAGLRKWLLARSVAAPDVEATIEALQARGALRLQQTRVEYST